MDQTGYAFVPLHNPFYYPQTTGTSQDQALGNKRFQQNQALFRRYTAVGGDLNKQTVTAVQPVFLSPLVGQLTGFGKFSAIAMLQNIFTSYGTIEKIDLEENAVKTMEPY